ncbi:lipid phosphate phosphatase 2 [Thecamonas trahens ATCC 50062]|uniref:Lipid phosphate phosphatase 2 n=1 Tax=Thecamonas trahens ATCC 50062 TaxID=461836 RepID=A0A0L0DRA7_THETB|nr:lipid phosphate phosphatase 2 [Thecamonas trahens ATCC 50062]KNC54782.1 lipid phosphate phosphatase 2 [Thecamonas trahens ATCC 50062]|eukprot:XP_013761682.1 lipid phosphate phosphatase 2 [Thecamonas trahens ATCC 50062]
MMILVGLIPPRKVAWSVTDSSISKSHEESSVPTWSVPIIGLALLGCVFATVQLRAQAPLSRSTLSAQLAYGVVTLGLVLGATGIVTALMKAGVGRLRPHFLAVCRPEQASNATDAPWICTGDSAKIAEARRSFPSGHTSVMFAGSVTASAFVIAALGPDLAVAAALLPIPVAVVVGMSRIWDHAHYPTDVVGGAILGSVVAVVGVALRFRFATAREHALLFPRRHRTGTPRKKGYCREAT